MVAFTLLRTPRLLLRPLRARDAADLHRLVNDWEVAKQLARVPFPYPRPLADEWIASTLERVAAGTAWHLAIADAATEAFLGCVGLSLSPSTPRQGELGYWIGRRHWRQGYAAEAAGRLVGWALANLEIDRIDAAALADNAASQAVLQRIGFRPAGEGRREFASRGGTLTVRLFSAGRDDLPGPALPAAAAPVLPPIAVPPGAPTIAPTENALSGTAPTGIAPTGIAPTGIAPTGIAPTGIAPTGIAPTGIAPPLLLVAAAALVDADGRVLLARRPEGKPLAGLWEFPGGKVAPGETPEAALIRELREELGIDVAASCLAPFTFASHAYAGFHLLMPLYLCRRWQGTVQGREGQALAWVRPMRLGDYAMPPADRPLVAMLRDFL